MCKIYINQLKAGDTVMRQWTVSPVIQTISWQRSSARPSRKALHDVLQLNGPSEQIRKFKTFFQGNIIENVVWKIATIWFKPQCVRVKKLGRGLVLLDITHRRVILVYYIKSQNRYIKWAISCGNHNRDSSHNRIPSYGRATISEKYQHSHTWNLRGYCSETSAWVFSIWISTTPAMLQRHDMDTLFAWLAFYMMTSSNFLRYWPFMRRIHRSPVNSPHKGQWRGALMFSVIFARMNGWVNNRYAGDLRRHQVHYDVIVMYVVNPSLTGECRGQRAGKVISFGGFCVVKLNNL